MLCVSIRTTSFPLDRRESETEYIFIYIVFSSLGKFSIFTEFFPQREILENHRLFPIEGKRENHRVFPSVTFFYFREILENLSTFSLSGKIIGKVFPSENYPLLFPNCPFINPITAVFFYPISNSFIRDTHVLRKILHCDTTIKSTCLEGSFE
ncbi:MAG: hypothetical protein K0S76_1882 [Herbinix sp.]|nr:hypothetical protein [Herbinix sp.]